MEVVADIRTRNMFTYPVLTISLLRKNGKFEDEEFARWGIEHNMRWSDSNIFIDDSVTSLSNCCRLKSNIEDLGYFNSIGGTALKVGSVKVSTVNLARLALEHNNEKDYLVALRDAVELDCKALDAVRHIIRRDVEKGLLPNFTHGLVDFEHLYNTVGVIGIYETMKAFGYTTEDEFGNVYYTEAADKFGKKIKDDEEKGLIPDFILHFPNNRDVIVDSKVNLKAYEAYINVDAGINGNDDIETKSRYCREHIAGVRRQVDLLAKKDYTKYLDSEYAKLNFVIMYMHNEGALNLALMNDSGLWKYAYDKGVLILGPQTMYMNLRILELMWTQSRQLGNQKRIVDAAEEMIKRTQIFVERFNEVDKCMKKTSEAFNKVKMSTANGGQSIITSAKKIINLGVKEDNGHAKISTLYIDEDATQMIGELDENSESTQQMNVIPEGDDEAVEKKYRN